MLKLATISANCPVLGW